VVGDGLVLTAEHLVAGNEDLRIRDDGGLHTATAIVVDPLADMAVLYAADVGAAALPLRGQPADRGTVGLVVGYPRGGSLEATPAVVLDAYGADQQDIYAREHVRREILEVQAAVVPGSSGGPVVDTDAALMGIVFGQAADDPERTYAVAQEAIAAILTTAEGLARNGVLAVPTGPCLATTDPMA
jgi:S1-C subfamily serine protease